MESKNYLLPFIAGVTIVACCLVFFQIGKANGYQRGYNAAINEPHKADTVWKEKIVYRDSLVEKIKWVDREKLVYVPVHDSTLVYVGDTVYLAQPMEHKLYSDENLEAEVSGIQPTLDWYKIHQKQAEITNTVYVTKHWNFGIKAGAGVFWDGKEIKPGLGAVFGFGYDF